MQGVRTRATVWLRVRVRVRVRRWGLVYWWQAQLWVLYWWSASTKGTSGKSFMY